jgi:hypothetical protein
MHIKYFIFPYSPQKRRKLSFKSSTGPSGRRIKPSNLGELLMQNAIAVKIQKPWNTSYIVASITLLRFGNSLADLSL